MLTVHRCLAWKVKGIKTHPEPLYLNGGRWKTYAECAYDPIVSITYTDGICPSCQKAMEELYNKPIDELIDEAKEMEVEQKAAKKDEPC